MDQIEFRSRSEPFPIPGAWSWAFLGKALRQRKVFTEIVDSCEYQRVTVQLHGRGVVPRDKVMGREIKTKNQQTLAPLDFLVAEIDAKMGGFGIVPEHLAGGIVSSHYFIFEINQALLLPGYLDAFLRVGFITKSITAAVRGSLNYAAIRPAHVSRIMFPYAPLPVQERVVEKLQDADRVTNLAREQLELFAALPGAIVREAIKGS